MRRKAVPIALAAAALAVVAYAGLWWYAASELRGVFDRWAADRRSHGWTVDFARARVTGFPFRIALEIEGPSVGAPHAAGGWRWTGPKLVAAAGLGSLGRATLSAPGVHRLVPRDGAAVEIRARAATGEIARPGDARTVSIAVDLAGVVVAPVGRAPMRRAETVVARVLLPDAGEPSVDLRLEAVALGEEPVPGLGPRIERATFTATLAGSVQPGPRRREIERWRDAGGTIEVSRLALLWQRLDIVADGTVALDAGLQPIAALSTDIAGYRVMIDGLAASGAIDEGEATAAKMALGLLARATSGGYDRISVPVTVQDRAVSLGPVGIARLPRLDWR